MKIRLFQELLPLDEEFGHVIHSLERMEEEPTYKKELIRWAKAHVPSAQLEANGQFFDEFDAIVEDDAIGAYKFLRDHRKRVTGPDDVYLEIKQREEARKAKGYLRPAARKAGVHIEDGQRFGLHNLRHSLSNWLVNKAKVEPKTVQGILRHSKIQTTLDLYTQEDSDETRAAQGEFLNAVGMSAAVN